jgi:DNA repair exonuclease SbcCD ATPase subunit
MEDLSTERMPPLIAAEINAIKHQAGKILLYSAIEIGRRLTEAKGLIPHGEWGKWLEESVSYSQRTAIYLIRLFEEYGSTQSDLPNSQALANLSYTQAIILLGVPEEERAQFIAELDLESMSTRELQKAVQERSRAAAERDQALEEKTELQQTLADKENRITSLSGERDNLLTKVEELNQAKAESEARAEKLSMDLKSLKDDTSAQAIDRMSNKLNEAYYKTKANKIAFLYESMDRNFRELLWELKEFANMEPDAYKVYKEKIVNFLAEGLKAKM